MANTIVLEPCEEVYRQNHICFEPGIWTLDDVRKNPFLYEHHNDFDLNRGALTQYFEDVMRGLSMPEKFWIKAIHIDTVVATCLHLQRYLLRYGFSNLVYSAELYHREGITALGSLDYDIASLFWFIERYWRSAAPVSVNAQLECLKEVINYIQEFLVYKHVPRFNEEPKPTLITEGSNSFIVAQKQGYDLNWGWVDLFQMGYNKGVLFGVEGDVVNSAQIMKRSAYIDFDLIVAATRLQEIETMVGGGQWRLENLLLKSPKGGSKLSMAEIVEVLIRV